MCEEPAHSHSPKALCGYTPPCHSKTQHFQKTAKLLTKLCKSSSAPQYISIELQVSHVSLSSVQHVQIQNTRSTVWLSADILILMSLFLKKNSQGSETQALPVTGPHGWPQRSMQLFPLLSQQVSLSCSNEEFTQMPPHKHNNPDLCFRLTESVHMNCFSFVYM